jgi:hypothetical protein
MKWIVLGIIIIALSVRLLGIGSFMTVDEENWMIRSSEFWHNFFSGDLGGTFRTTHPGATVMWIAGAGIVAQEARVGEAVDQSNLELFRTAATVPVAGVAAALIGLITWLIWKLFGAPVATASGVLLAVEPYLVGMSQIVHLDLLLGLCMLASLLAFLIYQRQPRTTWLILSGFLMGLAFGTKLLPALWLPLLIGIYLLWSHVWALRQRWYDFLRTSVLIGGVAVLTFYASWPALWVQRDLHNSFGKDIPSVVTEEHVALEEEGEAVNPYWFYGRTILGRTTPFVLILTGGATVVLLFYTIRLRAVTVPLWLLLYAVGFLILITLIAKKADRYAVPALVMLPVIAGWVLGSVHTIITNKQWVAARRVWYWAAGGVVAVALVGQSILWAPYTIAYDNPLWDVRLLTQQGWGEGLDAAGGWLSVHPLADRMMVASWYPGVLGTYFNGRATSLSAREDTRVGFVVLYRNMHGRSQDTIASDVLDEFRGQTPVYTVSIQGKPYVWIYDTLGVRYFIKHIGELVGGVTVGQTIPNAPDHWRAIEIGMATFSGRRNTEPVILHIREDAESTTDLRTVTVSATEIADQSWQRFEFEPITEAEGQTYYVLLESPTSTRGNAVTVRYLDKDLRPGDMYQRGQMHPGWDIAYRIPHDT